ncbi:phosphatidate cytidylyltransferase [Hymenobacter negativus]|uniref:Phosphatidate cytidylyltransferase n=1 Tax=Hymenobacter negativus TaxID=2795026 RepID=A0ABS0QBI9_9BACT|nr:phosphatidate cytidylyltransferase [Hymenobacter negativus]MBH8559569.1 phosphatidate cytidylyltransferase [Hymenobacter negativus]
MPDSTPQTIPAATPETTAAPAGPSNLRLRVIWGVIGAVLLLGSVWFSPFTFGLFFAAVQAIMLWEFYRMMRAGGYAPATWIGVGVSLALFGSVLFGTYYLMGDSIISLAKTDGSPEGNKLAEHITASFWQSQTWLTLFAIPGALLTATTVILLIREMFLWPKYSQPFANMGAAITGLLYISVPMTALIVLAFKPGGYDYRRVFALLFLIWASDIGAYAVGRAIGKHKLAPQISPGKTWEGWAGGFAMTLLVGWAIGYMLPDMPLMHRLVAAGVVAVFAPLGDLAESMLKRSVGVKDSGSIMPGHGGLLDRFDAFLLVLPVLALLQLLAG